MHPTGKAAVANRDIILGVKFQVGANMNGRYSLDFLKIARELCDTYKLPLMAHISFSPPSTDQVMELMRPGDIVTHCYNTHGIGILDENGKIKSSVTGARQRGVLFDIGHGAGSFNFGIARKALDQGFLPDSISTDVYTLNINGPVYDMPTTMSKMLALGMSLDDVLLRSTANPAKVVNRLAGAGGLSVGGPGRYRGPCNASRQLSARGLSEKYGSGERETGEPPDHLPRQAPRRLVVIPLG